MISVFELWLPVVVGTIVAFVGSFVAWALSPHHKPDYRGLGDHEGAAIDLIKRAALRPGQYMMPFCERNDPEMKQKMEQGCFATLASGSGLVSSGKLRPVAVASTIAGS